MQPGCRRNGTVGIGSRRRALAVGILALLMWSGQRPAGAAATTRPASLSSTSRNSPLSLRDIHLRDPFILPVPEEKLYYLYGTVGRIGWGGRNRFDVYVSRDLESWDGPYPAFRPGAEFWGRRQFWAPEVYTYRGRFYMFATFFREPNERGTSVLVADSPRGPFQPHSDGPVTPSDWLSLDGHLFVDTAGTPWLVFCHEWVQVKDGEICVVRLSEDLNRAVGKPILLFKASSAPWITPFEGDDKFVTDGPFLHRTRTGKLLMLWSSFSRKGYVTAVASSRTGQITGPWEQAPQPLYDEDGGHGMIFRTFDGRLFLCIHRPNRGPNEHPALIPIEEHDGTLRLVTPTR